MKNAFELPLIDTLTWSIKMENGAQKVCNFGVTRDDILGDFFLNAIQPFVQFKSSPLQHFLNFVNETFKIIVTDKLSLIKKNIRPYQPRQVSAWHCRRPSK